MLTFIPDAGEYKRYHLHIIKSRTIKEAKVHVHGVRFPV